MKIAALTTLCAAAAFAQAPAGANPTIAEFKQNYTQVKNNLMAREALAVAVLQVRGFFTRLEALWWLPVAGGEPFGREVARPHPLGFPDVLVLEQAVGR